MVNFTIYHIMKSVFEINQMCSGQVGGHHYVDLGLPSGLKWAVCNIGASEPWEFGDYFAWGRFPQRKIIVMKPINGEGGIISPNTAPRQLH